jgi:hypothetical protein
MLPLRQVFREAIRLPSDLWEKRTTFQTPMYVVGATLMLSGLFHVIVWLFSGEPWEGPISWRKPIVFGFSGGITTISVAWVMGFLRQRKSLSVLSRIFAVCMFIEVGLITMQKWRGAASHFNNATPFDSIVFYLMGTLIIIVAIVITIITVYSFRDLNTTPEMALAIRAGLALLIVGNLLGMLLASYGSYIVRTIPSHAPNIYGHSGMMKVPHAVALHAIQVLPFLAWLLSFTKHQVSSRLAIVLMAVIGYCGLQIFVSLQTFSGRAPFDVTIISAAISFISVILLAFAFLRTLLQRTHEVAR